MNSNLSRIILFFVGAALMAVFDTACNTSQSFGKDVEKVGEKIQEKAR